jgi:hypothetical protein
MVCAPGMQVAPVHASPTVQALPSLHAEAAGRLTQWPSLPATLHAMQSLGSPFAHKPSQQSPSTQKLPDVHSRQFPALQWVAVLHAPAKPTWGAHCPLASQK